MIFSEKRFFYALSLTLLQQFLLALSTYYIALAGAALTDAAMRQVMLYISLFFLFALMAYMTSSAAAVLSTVASNSIWKKYANSTLVATTKSLELASEKNRKTISQWLGSEALPTVTYACELYLETTSVCTNIIFTIVVFYISTGKYMALTVTISLLISFLLTTALRRTIEISAKKMQQRKLGAMLSIEPTWNAAMFGNRTMRSTGFDAMNAKIKSYTSELKKYILLEQAVACIPTVITTLAVILIFQFTSFFTTSIAGALVALLPRSLQVFGNVHSLSICLSKFFLVRSKLHNLIHFSSRLPKYDHMQEAPLHAIVIWDMLAKQKISPTEFIKNIHEEKITNGRFMVTGANGSGKTTLLKIIKGLVKDAILITPETNFFQPDRELSTGQRRHKEVINILSMRPPVIMLDEWDANLDNGNFRQIDHLLETACTQMVVIEVRHLRGTTSMLDASQNPLP